MPTETLDDWNEIIGCSGCCNMPYCTEANLKVLTQAKRAQTNLVYSYLDGSVFYRDRRRTYDGGGYEIFRWSADYEVLGVPYANPSYGVFSSVPPLTGGTIDTYENEITLAEIIALRDTSVASAISALDWSVGTIFDNLYKASYRIDYVGPDLVDIVFLQFRFQIDADFVGTYFKFTYDIDFFPEGGGASTPLLIDQFVEWITPGGGTGPQSDPSWLVPYPAWIQVPFPALPGENRIVNIRFTCYRGTLYGAAPQIISEDSFP